MTKLTCDLQSNLAIFRSIFHSPDNADFIIRRLSPHGVEMAVLYIDGMASRTGVEDMILRPLMEMRPFGTESTGCFGWDGMAGTTLRIDPARGLTTVFGIQRIPAKSDCFIPPLLDAIKQVWPVEG